MSLSKMFKTDDSLETGGIVLDYGNTRIRIARAGGANKKFAKLLAKMVKPFQRAIAAGSFDNEQSVMILKEAYAKTIILGWQTKHDDKWADGVDPEDMGLPGDAGLQPANFDSYMAVFANLPELFHDLMEQAQKIALFRADLTEAGSGN
jgi:hypothetical protein